MEPYAVVETGGKQYLVKAGESLAVEHLAGDVGKQVILESVLAVSDGKELTVGSPTVAGAKVTAEIAEQKRGPKLFSFHKRRRKGSAKKTGHRQEQTVLKIAGLSHG